nr:reverse transcriptase domain-containing protein [Tanacetum cinerariifolium]
MRTRFNFYPFNSTATIPRRSNRRRVPNIVEPEIHTIEEIILMADRTMEELLQEPTEGDVSNNAIKLMLFSYSLEGAARIWDNVSKTDNRIDKLADQISNLVEIVNKQVIAPAKAIEKTCVTCEVPNNQIQQGVLNEFLSYMKSNEIMIKSMQNQINLLRGNFNKQEENLRRNLNEDMRSILGSFFQNQPSTLGTLPSNTMPNPKGEMKVVTTRSGLAYEGPSIPTNSPLEKVDEQNIEEIMDKEHSNCLGSTTSGRAYFNSITRCSEDSIEAYNSLSDKLFELAKVSLNENCLAMLLKKLPEKLGDLGKFLIPCDFLGMEVCHALADLGASINLMPLSIWKKLSLPELTPTRMTLELADRSITRPKGVAKDVFVKVGKFHFPTYFVVVDFEADPRVPLILGRSFLRTGRTLIDVYGEEITLRVNNEFVTFNLNQIMRYSLTYDDNSVNRVYVINIACEEFIQDNTKSSNPTLVSENDVYKEPILKSSSPSLTPFRESDFFLEIEDFLNYDSILTGFDNSLYDNSLYDLEGDILYLENFLNEDPFQLHPMNLKQAKFPIEEPKYSLSMGYKHLSTTPETESDEVTESSDKNLVPILSEYEITSDDESEYEVPVKDDSSPAFTTFSNPLLDRNDNFTSSDNETILDEDVPIEEFKVYSNLLFNSDEIDPHCLNVESNCVESLSNHDALINSSPKFDYLEEFSDALMPTSIADEERIRIESMQNTSVLWKFQDSDSQREEIDIVTEMDELLPPIIESDDYDSKGDINVLEELLVDDSISLPKNKSFYFDHQDDPSFLVLLQNQRMLSLILSPIQEK